jgi:hypothetical protein
LTKIYGLLRLNIVYHIIMSTIISTNQKFDEQNYHEGHFFAFFTGKPDSKLFQSQLESAKATAEQLELREVSVFFLSQEETEDDTGLFILDPDLEVLEGVSKFSKNNPGERMFVMQLLDGNLTLIDQKENPEHDSDWVKALLQFGDNYNDMNPDADGYYKWGQKAPENGEYLCKDCGYILELEEGQVFPICEVCLAGEPNGPSTPEEGYWEKI